MIRLWAGYATSVDRFVVSAGKLDDENPRSVTLSYNALNKMTWGYADLPRTIKSVAGFSDGGGGKPLFVALSNEGDVYWLKDDIPVEKIEGAGVWSDDAEGWGSMNHIAVCDGRLIACGDGSQVYERRGQDNWPRLCDRNLPGVADSAFYGMACRPAHGLVAVCGQKRTIYRTPSADEKARIDGMKVAGDKTRAKSLEAQARTVETPKSSCLYLREGATWHEAMTGYDGGLNACLALPGGAVLAVGDHGVILKASGPDTIEDFSEPGLNDNFYTVGLWGREITVLGDTGVHVLGADLRFRRTIALPKGLTLPNRHQVLGDDLFYLDYAGVAFYRDETWRLVQIPDDIWAVVTG